MPIGAPIVYRLQRRPSTEAGTVGDVTIEGSGQFLCYTVEDTVREVAGQPVESWKKPGDTAIPSGKYRIIVAPSARFGASLPRLVDVPGFEGILIHPGNSRADTEGCILPGLSESDGNVWRSRAACAVWQDQITKHLLAGREVWISIFNA